MAKETKMEVEVIKSEAALSLITKAEIDVQISTAKAFPRSIKTFLERAEAMATISDDVAESCNYAVPRGNKHIQGPSVRLAEIVSSTYGNLRSGARVIANDGKWITAQGICHDLENNNCITVEVKRKITDRYGKTYTEDMQTVTGNAACAIAFRNAVFKVVPSALISPIYQKTLAAAKGKPSELEQKRKAALDYFESEGISNEKVLSALGLKKIEDINMSTIAILRGMVSSIKNGETTIQDLFEGQETTEDKKEELKKNQKAGKSQKVDMP